MTWTGREKWFGSITAVIVGTCLAAVPIAYTTGQGNQEAKDNLLLLNAEKAKAELDGKVSQLQIELGKAQANVKSAEATVTELKLDAQAKATFYAGLQQQVAASSSCRFIHEEIKETIRRIDAVGTAYWVNGDKPEMDAKRQVLEQRLTRYQEQLGKVGCV